jgi:uncharacterized membrane protein
MIFDLKLPENTTSAQVISMLWKLAPKFLCYTLSFIMVAIMWVNHHQMLQPVKRTDAYLLWWNTHLLFWMSFIPFGTNVIGAHLFLREAIALYGIIFFCNSVAFYLLRLQTTKYLLDTTHNQKHKTKNIIGVSLYASSICFAYISIYLSFAVFIIVPAMYFMPQKEEQNTK